MEGRIGKRGAQNVNRIISPDINFFTAKRVLLELTMPWRAVW